MKSQKKKLTKSKTEAAPVEENVKKTPPTKPSANSELIVFEFPPYCGWSSANDQRDYVLHREYTIGELNRYYDAPSCLKASTLVNLAVMIIRELERLTKNDPIRVNEVAARRVTWPVLAGRHSALNKKNEALFDQIGLGSGGNPRFLFNFSEIPINLTPAKKWTLELLQVVAQIRGVAAGAGVISEGKPNQMTDEHKNRLFRYMLAPPPQPLFPAVKVNWQTVFEIGKLPEFAPNEKSIQAWQKAAWKLLLLNTNDHPEHIPELCAIGEHRRYQQVPKKTTRPDLLELLVDPDKQRKNIAREVRVNIFDEILKIAKHLQKLKPPTEEK